MLRLLVLTSRACDRDLRLVQERSVLVLDVGILLCNLDACVVPVSTSTLINTTQGLR